MERRSFRPMAIAYLGIIGSLCVASLTALWWSQTQHSWPPFSLLVIICGSIAAANYFTTRIPIDARRGIYVGVSEAPFVFAILTAGPIGIVPVLIADITTSRIVRRSRWVDVYLNITHTSMLYLLLFAWFQLFTPLVGFNGVIAVIGVALGTPIWDSVTLSLILHISTGRPIWSFLREKITPTAWISSIPLSLGGLAGLLYPDNAWLISLMLLPLILSYFAIRAVARWLAESAKVRELAKELEALNHELEQRVAERTARVTQLLELRAAEMSAVVHDMRHHLETIQQTTDMLHLLLPPSLQQHEAIGASWETLQNGFYMARALLGQMLDASLMEQGKLTLSPRATALRDTVQQVLRLFSARCALQDCHVAVIASNDLPLAWCDPIRIERVLYNVIDNAIRYAVDYDEQRPEPEGARVIVQLSTEHDTIYCVVSDNGPGIGAEQLSGLGQLGLRLVQDVQRVEGAGLGLNFCFRILALSGGALQLSSAGPGQGTTVTIGLPRAAPDGTMQGIIAHTEPFVAA